MFLQWILYLSISVLNWIQVYQVFLVVTYGSLVDFIVQGLSLVEKVYNDYKIIINGIVILIGLFLCFLGKKTVKVVFHCRMLFLSLICLFVVVLLVQLLHLLSLPIFLVALKSGKYIECSNAIVKSKLFGLASVLVA